MRAHDIAEFDSAGQVLRTFPHPRDLALTLFSLLSLTGCVITAEYQPLHGEQEDNVGFGAYRLLYSHLGFYVAARGALSTPLTESRTPGAGDIKVDSDVDPSVVNFGVTYPLAKAYSDPAAEPRERPRWMLHAFAGLGWARRTEFEKYARQAGGSYWIKADNPEDEVNFNLGLLAYYGHFAITVGYDTVFSAASFGIGYAF